MLELGMIPLVMNAASKVSHSALPDSPVVVEPPPRPRLRARAAGALHRLADRLDDGRPRRKVTAVYSQS